MQALATAVRKALDAKSIGVPVAVRIIAYNNPNPDSIDRQLAFAIRLSQEWLRGPVSEAHAVGSVFAGERTVLLRFQQGQSATISVGVCGTTTCRTVAIVFGTLGTISWESDERSGGEIEDSLLFDGIEPTSTVAAAPTTASDTGPAPTVVPAAVRLPRSAPQPRVPSSPPYGILLVAGEHTHQPMYAAAFAADSRCQLIGLTDSADISADRREFNRRLSERLGLPYFQQLDAALARADVDVVSVCAEPQRRSIIIEKAAEAGKHLYLDKPLCGSPSEVRRIVSAVRKSGVFAHMFSQVQWQTAQRTKALLESERLGAIVAIHAELCFAKGPSGTVKLLETRNETGTPNQFELPEAKRELTNIGVYGLVLLLSLLKRNIQTVTASTGNYFFREHKQHDMEDFGQIVLEFEDGITGSVTAGRTGWHSHPRDGINRVHLLGTRGAVTVDADHPRTETWSAVTAWQSPERNPDDPMGMWVTPTDSPYRARPKQAWVPAVESNTQDDVKYFVDCLERGQESDVSVEVAGAASEALFAAYRSAASGQTVALSRSDG